MPSSPARTPASRMQLVKFGELLLQQEHQGTSMFNWQLQTAGGRLVTNQSPWLHQGIDTDLKQTFVMSYRFQALNFDVKELQCRSSGSMRGPHCRPCSEPKSEVLQCSKLGRKRVA